jgi:hypothetical protein
MIKLTVEQYDAAVGKIASEIAACDEVRLRTRAAVALMVLEALGEDFDVTTKTAAPAPYGPAYWWNDSDAESAFANALNRFAQGLN